MRDQRTDDIVDLLDELHDASTDVLALADRRTAVGRALDRLAVLAGRIRDAHARDTAAAGERESALIAEVGRLVVRDAARAAIGAAGGNVELMLPVVATNLQAVEQDGEWVVRVIEGDRIRHIVRQGTVVEMEPGDLVAELRRNPVFASAFDAVPVAPIDQPTAVEQPGAGAGGKNPFAKGPTWNLTEQMKLQRENPALAAAMKAKADGVSEDHANPFQPGPGWSLTMQMKMQRQDPDRAQRLKAEAKAAS